MVTLISNPTISFPVSIPHVRAISSTSDLQISNCSISSKKLLFRYRNWRKSSEVRIGVSTTRRSVISCGVTEINQTQFSETVLKSDTPVLVEFVATWCGPCRLISPAVEWAAEEYKDKLKIFKIDHDANPQLIEEYKVYGLPTLILFKDGQEVPESRWEGAMTKAKLKEYLDGLLKSKAMT